MSSRNTDIDLMKGLLTIGMVFAHATHFLNNRVDPILAAVSVLLSLVCFSGFLFCFGFACWLAYLSKERIPWPRVLRSSLRCHLAFVLSGVGFRVLVSNEPLTARLLARVALLRDVPNYSEFLAAFALVGPLCCALARYTGRVTRSVWTLAAAGVSVLIVAAVLPGTVAYDPWVGLMIGGAGPTYFPVLLYLPLFLLGVYRARCQEWSRPLALIVASLGVGALMALALVGVQVRQFPPDAFWIGGSAAAVYLCYEASRSLAKYAPYGVRLYLNIIGRNTLYYLVVSNLVLFTVAALEGQGSYSASQTVVADVALMGGIYCLQYMTTDLASARAALRGSG